MFNQVETHLAGPADAAFHEAKIESRIAVHQAAEKNTAGKHVVRLGEVADVIVGEVSDGGAILPAAAARVLGHGYAELNAPFPKRLVVIGAVEGDGVAVPGRFLPIDSLRRARDLSLLVSPQHDRFEATLLDHIF